METYCKKKEVKITRNKVKVENLGNELCKAETDRKKGYDYSSSMAAINENDNNINGDNKSQKVKVVRKNQVGSANVGVPCTNAHPTVTAH